MRVTITPNSEQLSLLAGQVIRDKVPRKLKKAMKRLVLRAVEWFLEQNGRWWVFT